jgi:hypothetical protein
VLWIAGIIVVAILIGAGTFYYYGRILGSSGIGGSSAPPITVTSAQLGNNDVLTMNVENNGQSSTKTIQALDACAPDFSQCEDLNAYSSTFVLPSGNSYIENLTIPQVGFSSYIAPGWGAPVTGQTYYFKVGVTLANGDSQDVDISAITTGHYAFSNFFGQPNPVSITAVDSSSLEVFGNLSGRMSIVLTLNSTLSTLITANLLNATDSSSGAPEQATLVTASNGASCGDSCPNIIPQGPSQVTLAADFSSVTTGVSAGTYYIVTVNFENYATCFLWVQAQNVSA